MGPAKKVTHKDIPNNQEYPKKYTALSEKSPTRDEKLIA